MIRIELPHVTVMVDDRFRNRLAERGERLGRLLTAYMRAAADDADGLGRKASAACHTAAARVDTAMAAATDRIGARSEEPCTIAAEADDSVFASRRDNADPRRRLHDVHLRFGDVFSPHT